MDSAALLRAAASNHRAWFRRCALARRGHVERIGPVELVVDPGGGTIAFPRTHRVEAAAERIRELRLPGASCWSLAPDHVLGTKLVARGFGWGWQPHWMSVDLARPLDDPQEHEVVTVDRAFGNDLPYGSRAAEPPRSVHLAIRRRGEIAGHAVVHPWRGVAGIYSMGVVPQERRRGIGRAITLAACRVAAERGCTHAILNATDEGERLYRAVGFESLGWGQTWWYFRRRRPTSRQVALAEAIGFGDLDVLAALRPTPADLARRLPGDTSPLRLAVVTGRLDSAAWILDRAPALAERRFEPYGGTLLHLAVESNRPEIAALALDRGTDPGGRDRVWNATPLQWAQHAGLTEMARLIAERCA